MAAPCPYRATLAARLRINRRINSRQVGGRVSEPAPVAEDYYIVADRSPADERTLVLKHGETFAVFDHFGDIQPGGLGEQGIYHEGTRHLSALTLSLARQRPLYLSSTVTDDNTVLTADLTNPDIQSGDLVVAPRGTIHLSRNRFLWQGVCYEHLQLRNYGLDAVTVGLGLQFQADFADIFEVRGTKRPRRGQLLEPVVTDDGATLAYLGLDGVTRRTRLTCQPRPAQISGAALRFEVALDAGAAVTYLVTIACETGGVGPRPIAYDEALAEAERFMHAPEAEQARIATANEQFDAWLRRSAADLRMMMTETPNGLYPYAGVPWFSVPFGRDGIITALELLWLQPRVARGVLAFLAATQADAVIPEQDAEPGKILHETRRGEMAALGEIPFGRYYGSVDATPLFVLLAGAYHERTGDRAFIEAIWPNIERALRWIDAYGDRDGDGFVEYARMTPTGLVQQGWKDSHDSVFHADGRMAEPPIALCEVQGYVYAAKRHAARLAALLGHAKRARALEKQAEALRVAFERAFWLHELSTYALALDGRKQPCRVRASNAGHCLFAGIAAPDRAARVAWTLLGPATASGWGLRTLAATEARYNPMSYHNGSIWPHDNALIAAGLAAYGFTDHAVTILGRLFDASLFVNLHRLPELYCGFGRLSGQGPTLYPVACTPQSWASGAVFLLLQACLGLTIDGPARRVRFRHPRLPASLRMVRITNLRVGDASVDLELDRHPQHVGITVLRKEGQVEVVSEF
jgi:glycogen debranching enzyme